MNPERWQEIDKLLSEALKREPGQREDYLELACVGDAELRQEVRALLEAHDRAGSFMEKPAVEATVSSSSPPSLIGRKLGPFEVFSFLGRGGMGEVYRVRDTRLDRIDALKILPTDVAKDPDRLRRFIREAQAASALNHPNIATIHEIGESDGIHWIGMELVEGQTLAQRIKDRPLKLEEILDIGIQAAEALAEAHSKGIIHRDIKPANMMLTPKGAVKILDFGLAKREQREGPATDTDTTETHTVPGMVMGTARYMSPEQVLGQPVDHRTDIFSLGVVLYEMAVGQPPFRGDSSSAVLDAIVHQALAWPPQARNVVPEELKRIIARALEKSREMRHGTASDLSADLKRLKRDSESIRAGLAGAARERPVWWPRKWELHLGIAALALVAVVAVLVGLNVAHLRDQLFGRATAPRIESLAVLPLANLSGDPQQEHYADGVTEDLIINLGKVSSLRVISRHSAMHYKGMQKTVPEIARELGVDAVVEGTVRRSGNNVRITAELLRATPEAYLWGESYEREAKDILALQSEVAQAIVNEIKTKVTPGEQARLVSTRSVKPEAYEAYLRGRHFWTSDFGGLDYFEKATQLDPAFAPAYSGMALCYAVEGFTRPPREAFPKAAEAAMKALQLDPELAEAHAALGYTKFNFEWDWAGAEREFRKAIDLNPGSSDAHWMYAVYLTAMTRFDEAMSEAKRAHQFDPFSPWISDLVGWVFMSARRYDEAIAQFKSTLELVPGFLHSWSSLAGCYTLKGMYSEAYRGFNAAGATLGDPWLGYLDAVTGKRERALKGLEALKRKAEHEYYFDPYYMAVLYGGLGDKDGAFACLEKAYEERSAQMPQVKMEPWLDPLRADPRYQELLHKMNLSEQ
jgi:TolB-like protein